MKRKVIFLLILLAGKNIFLQAQGEKNWWFFGYNAGLNFNGGAPVAAANGQINTDEGCSAISDASGNLLFYTDGVIVWNRNHVQMPNGFGLRGSFSASQSALIVKKPGSANIYYIFTVDELHKPNGVCYSEVDMTLNGGLGDVTANKNILLQTPSCEKICGIRHCNKKDVWVVTHDWNNNTFRTFLVSAAGVNPVPVLSNTGSVVTGTSNDEIGYLKASQDGRKLVSAIVDVAYNLELFDFDNSTGIVSNPILIPQPPAVCFICGIYGVEFSPDGTKLYAAIHSPGKIYQYDLCAGSATAIINSGTLIGTSLSEYMGALQLGPDNKIYLAKFFETTLGVINNPNALGLACNYTDNGVSLGIAQSAGGLPNFVSDYYYPPAPPFTTTVTCSNANFTSPIINSTNCSGLSNLITSVLWNFGDPSSGANNTTTVNNPGHTYTSSGTFNVQLLLNYACHTDTLNQQVTIAAPVTATVTPIAVSCNGGSDGSGLILASGGTGPYIYSWNTIPSQSTATATGLSAGVYSVTITDNAGCSGISLVTITEPALLVVSIPSVTNVNCHGGNSGSATAIANGGTMPYSYSWSQSAATLSTLSGLSSGIYTVTVTDSNGCSAIANTTITQSAALVPNVASTNSVSCKGGTNGSASVNVNGGTPNYTYSWSNGQTGMNVSALQAGTHTVIVTDAYGCIASSTVSIIEPTALVLNIPAVLNVSCNNGSDGSATVSALGGAGNYTYSWNTSPAQTTPTAINLSAGNYNVVVTDGNGCSATRTFIVTQPSPLLAGISPAINICMGQNVTLTASIQGGTPLYSYTWSSGNTGSSVNVSPTSTTQYMVTVTDQNGCTAVAGTTVNVNSALQVSASNPAAICPGNNALLSASGSGGGGSYTFTWLPQGITTATMAVTPTTSTTYTIVLTDNCGTPPSISEIIVTVNALPSVSFTANDTSGCEPVCVNFVNTSPTGITCYWTFGDGGSSTNNTPQHCYTIAGNYGISLTVTDANGCSNTINKSSYIKVHPNPTAGFTMNPNPASINSAISFMNKSIGANAWIWSFGDIKQSTSSQQNPQFTYTDSGYFHVQQIVINEFGCSDTAQRGIYIQPEYLFYIPNTFTPNGDGLNDVFLPKCIAINAGYFEMYIFDRWGSLIWSTKDAEEGWNGKANGGQDVAQIDTYVWKINLKDVFGYLHGYVGNVNLVR